MPNTGKGVYIKSNPSCDDPTKSASISDITYEDISITNPKWWAIWIGPQQQQEPGMALGEKCSLLYPFGTQSCPTQGCVSFDNITLRRINITNPVLSPGVILGNATNPIRNLTFEDVKVTNPGKERERKGKGKGKGKGLERYTHSCGRRLLHLSVKQM